MNNSRLNSPFSNRAVISQIETRECDEVHVSYTSCTHMYQEEILEVLTGEKGMSNEEALNYLTNHRTVYSEGIHQIITNILSTTK
ncbi:hypothetical protein TSMG0162 [Halocynthia phage JM-2012]|uniref:hypothetical protein n=1 Tax=Halocynthia phage JM-2012 TaxID=1173297 RepID=UPI00025C697E|nr:hypothetical protein TSMG0162 [Halocynthia phage JM-2012]AFI55445.1 hypothetical protein TSMG0162 [Halocynthia phage JM-2012]